MAFKQKLHRTLAVLAMLVSILVPLSSISLAHAASNLPHTPKLPNWAATYTESPATFWDSNYNSIFTLDGSLYLDAAYVTNPPEINDQHMYVHIPNGAFYGQYPSTFDTVNDKNGTLIGTYNITGGGCVGPGYPDSSECGDNYSSVAPSNWSNCPVTVYHHWIAIDDGVAVGSGNRSHTPNLC